LKNTYCSPIFILLLITSLIVSCGDSPTNGPAVPEGNSDQEASVIPAKPSASQSLTPEFKEYWYAGVAELNSYELEQARYGELRDGEAVLIFVTEPFNTAKQVKADRKNPSTTSVMKLNRVRKFLTGVYPYSVMSSIFYPVSGASHALKITTSVQEWCGHVFAQLNNRETFEIQSNSYFESEADQAFSIEKNVLEDELWTMIRTQPGALPEGSLSIVPSLEYLRLKHREIKAYNAEVTLTREAGIRQLTVLYPELDRTLSIQFQEGFPYRIEGWSESYPSGGGAITSTARLNKTILSPYWQKNGNSDLSLRDSLGLEMR
jgi:hypothetical protein